MRSVANRLAAPLGHLLLAVLLPVGTLAAQARSSMEVSVQVVHREYAVAAAALIQPAATGGPARSAIDSDAECKMTGNMVIAAGVSASCGWDPDSHAFLLTVQY